MRMLRLKHNLRYLSIFSGIETSTVAWQALAWQASAVAEIDPFACAVLDHHHPSIPNLGDVTHVDWSHHHDTVDILVGGPPCQDFSTAGRRAGMDGASGGLIYWYAGILGTVRPRWFLFENVPGILSANSGLAFAKLLETVEKCGYQVVWRVLDARHFGIPQSRRRLYLIGYFGDWRPAAAVLFEPESLRRDHPPRRHATQEYAGTLTASADRQRGSGISPGHIISCYGGGKSSGARDVATTLTTRGNRHCFNSDTLAVSHDRVRRLTPLEWERLQGLPDNYTLIPYRGRPAFDGPRYRVIGNAMAVPVIRWIGRRIQMVEDLL